MDEKYQSELKERVEGFYKGYGELVEKWGIDMAQYPVYIPDGNNGFRTVLQATPVDTRKNDTENEKPVEAE